MAKDCKGYTTLIS